MRKKNRAVENKEDILKIIDKCDCCRLGFCYEDKPYVVPMNFGYTYENEKLTLYFHGDHEGKKMDLIRLNPNVCFEMDCSHEIVHNEIACLYTMKYESVIGEGKMSILTDDKEKSEALKHVMRKYAPDRTFEFESKHTKIITGLKLEVETFMGKHSTKGGPL